MTPESYSSDQNVPLVVPVNSVSGSSPPITVVESGQPTGLATDTVGKSQAKVYLHIDCQFQHMIGKHEQPYSLTHLQ